eukprot:1906969-Prorocentrum_lima.AAC.1
MTSSLVGSEMCIRDRVHRAALVQFAGVRDHMQQRHSRRGVKFELIQSPVSYTHLTLPTICSV